MHLKSRTSFLLIRILHRKNTFWMGIWLLGILQSGFSQNLQVSSSLPDSSVVSSFTQETSLHLSLKAGKNELDTPGRMQMEAILPRYFRQNPSGYSFLCRKELLIENKLPVGIWVDAERPDYLKRQLGTGLNLRLKLLRF